MSGPHNILLIPFLFGISAAGEPQQPAATPPQPKLAASADIIARQEVANAGPARTDQKPAEISTPERVRSDLERLSLRAQFRNRPDHVPK